jgi:hypothetical protein
MTSESNRTFTSQRLDWEKCLRFDRRIPPFACEVGCAIASHASATNGKAYVSDETLADEVGFTERYVRRARVRLRETRWLKWRRTGDANVYTLLFDQVSGHLDMFITAREARKEQRKKRKSRFPDRNASSDHKPADRNPSSYPDRNPSSAILPSRNTLVRKGLSIESILEAAPTNCGPTFSTINTSTKH